MRMAAAAAVGARAVGAAVAAAEADAVVVLTSDACPQGVRVRATAGYVALAALKVNRLKELGAVEEEIAGGRLPPHQRAGFGGVREGHGVLARELVG